MLWDATRTRPLIMAIILSPKSCLLTSKTSSFLFLNNSESKHRHVLSYNSILSHKGVKKIFCTHRHERVHKNDFKHECPKSRVFTKFLSGFLQQICKCKKHLHCFSELECLKSILCTSWRGV